MTNAQLEAKGWKLVKVVRYSEGDFHAWKHPDHQNEDRGFFTKTDASEHQTFLDKGNTCHCIKSDGGEMRKEPLL